MDPEEVARRRTNRAAFLAAHDTERRARKGQPAAEPMTVQQLASRAGLALVNGRVG